MIDRKKAVEDQMREYRAAVSKTLDVFGKENYGQAVTQWNFTSLRQVLEGAFNDLAPKIIASVQECIVEIAALEAEKAEKENSKKEIKVLENHGG